MATRRPHPLLTAALTVLVLLLSTGAEALDCPQGAQYQPPRNFGGADWELPAGAVLCDGAFTNIGRLHLPPGRTVHLQPGASVALHARVAVLSGTIDGEARGHPGGEGCQRAAREAGEDGLGPGAGEGAVGAEGGTLGGGSGGGGAGHGGAGGTGGRGNAGAAPGSGGTSHGEPLRPGSGGGGGSCGSADFDFNGRGGAGGGALAIHARDLQVAAPPGIGTPRIDLDGAVGVGGWDGLSFISAGGGGGSGGHLVLDASERLVIEGTLDANGGRGGAGAALSQTYIGGGGGGGAGGRIVLRRPSDCGGPTGNVQGGAGGAAPANRAGLAGAQGARSCTNVQDPPRIEGLAVGPAYAGQDVAVTVTATDPNGHLLLYAFDCDGDGVFEIGPQTSPAAACRYDAVGGHTVRVGVTDWNSIDFTDPSGVVVAKAGTVPFGGEATESRNFDVGLQPSAVALDAPSSGNEGAPLTFAAEIAPDPGLPPFEVRWRFGDGSAGLAGEGLVEVTHTYDDDGEYTVTLTVTDARGAIAVRQADIRIHNVAPAITQLSGPAGGDEGTPLSFTAAATDPSTADTDAGLTYTWDFGDGSAPRAGRELREVSHAFADDGAFTVTLTVTDKDGGSTVRTHQVRMANVVPAVALELPSVREGEWVRFVADAIDPSPVDQAAGFHFRWDLGDGSALRTGHGLSTIEHVYLDDGDYTVTVVVTDKNGGVTTRQGLARIANVAPAVGLSGDLQGDEGTVFTFNATASDQSPIDQAEGLEFTWDFGDGTPVESGKELTLRYHVYRNSGRYILSLTVADKDGGATTITRTIEVDNVAPTVTLNSPSTAPEGTLIELRATGRDPSPEDQAAGFLFRWDPGDGSPISEGHELDSLSHVYADDGNYLIRLTVTDGSGGTRTVSIAIEITNRPPVVSLAAIPSLVAPGEELIFKASAQDPSPIDRDAGFTYDFIIEGPGDSEDVHVVFGPAGGVSWARTFEAAGDYTISVTALDKDGGRSLPVRRTFVVDADIGMSLRVSIVPDSVTIDEGHATTFVSVIQNDNPYDPPEYEITWTFGDGSPPVSGFNRSVATHAFADSGEYTVRVDARNARGAKGSATASVRVRNTAPSAWVAGDVSGFEGGIVQVQGGATDAPADEAAGLTFRWSWGDGTPDAVGLELRSPTHVYRDDGTFVITLTVTDQDGARSTPVTEVARIANLPPVLELHAPSGGEEGSPLRFSAMVTDPSEADVAAGFQFEWTFGDGSAPVSGSSITAVDHAFPDDGRYEVTLKVTDKDGGAAFASSFVSIENVPPTVEAGPDLEVQRHAPVTFRAEVREPSTVDAAAGFTWRWEFGDGDDSADKEPSHRYSEPGRYTVKVSATDKDGGTGGDALEVHVLNRPPTVQRVAIVPARPRSTDSLWVEYEYSDVDGDPEDGTQIRWYLNGEHLPELDGRHDVPPSRTVRGQRWAVEIIPDDGWDAGEAGQSEPVFIRNEAPSASEVRLAPESPRRADRLVLSYVFFDADRDPELGSRIEWLRNGLPVPELDDLREIPAPLERGDLWRARVFPGDGAELGEQTESNEVEVANTPPVVYVPVFAGPATGPLTAMALWVEAEDPDGDPLAITWSIAGRPVAEGPEAVLEFVEGTHRVDVRVDDGTDAVPGVALVAVGDVPPIVDAGPDREVDPGRIRMGATAADPLGRPLTFAWTTEGSPELIVLDSPGAAQTSFFARREGAYRLSVQASSGRLESADAVTVTMRNLPPWADPGLPVRTARVGEALLLDGRASADPNGDSLTFEWAAAEGSARFEEGPTGPLARVIPDGPGVFTVRLTVSDGKLSSSADVEVRASPHDPQGFPPVAAAKAVDAALVGERVQLDGRGSYDLDGEPLTFRWVQIGGSHVSLEDDRSALATFAATAHGAATFRLVVSDGRFDDYADVAIDIVEDGTNRRPLARISPASTQAPVGARVVLDGAFSEDPDGDPLSFRWRQVSGPQVTLEGADAAQVAFVPTVEATLAFELVVRDGRLDSRPANAVVRVGDDALPLADAGPAVRGYVGDRLGFDAARSRPGREDATLSYVWTQVGGPHSVLSGDGPRPTFVPAVPGRYTFELVVFDGRFSSEPARVEAVVEGLPLLRGGCGCASVPGALPLLTALALGLLRRRRS